MLARVRRVSLLPLVGLFAMNPAVMQNATYTWTKLLTAFFVILALSLYLSAWRKRDSIRMTAAFVALAAGLLVHYSAGPYVVFFAVHYLLVVFRTRPAKWKELAAISVASGLLLFTWFGWSIATYGVKPTFASNTSITASQQYEGSNAGQDRRQYHRFPEAPRPLRSHADSRLRPAVRTRGRCATARSSSIKPT